MQVLQQQSRHMHAAPCGARQQRPVPSHAAAARAATSSSSSPLCRATTTTTSSIYSSSPHQQHRLSAAAPRRPVSPAPPAAAATSTATTQQDAPSSSANGASGGGYNWLKQWWPLAIVSQLDPSRPNAAQLLGRPLVLWRNPKTAEWVCFEDRCPHRLAPLSEGRLDPGSGDLMCSYHGWQFDSTGACTAIPQIAEPAALKTACASKRTCAVAYPCREATGLLWVWMDADSADEAASSPPALVEQFADPAFTMLGGEWFERTLPYGYEVGGENLFDASHIPFAHHKIMGDATRDKAQPLDITTVKGPSLGGFQLARDTAPFRTRDQTDTLNFWRPPALNCSIQTNKRTGNSLALCFYVVPLAPGASKVITAFFTNRKLPWAAKAATAALQWVFHLGQNQVLDSDAMLLHVQERLLQDAATRDSSSSSSSTGDKQQQQQPSAAAEPAWRSAFYMPSSADTGIISFRKWLDLAGPLPWPPGCDATLGPVAPRAVVLDRLHQHTEGCKDCRAALAWAQRLRAACLVLGGAAAAAAIATLTAARVTAAAASAGAASTAASAQGGIGGLLAAVPALHTGVAAGVALLALVGAALLRRLEQRFVFVDYVHAAVP